MSKSHAPDTHDMALTSPRVRMLCLCLCVCSGPRQRQSASISDLPEAGAASLTSPRRQGSTQGSFLRFSFARQPKVLSYSGHAADADAFLLNPLHGQNISSSGTHDSTGAYEPGGFERRRGGSNVSVVGDMAGPGLLLLPAVGGQHAHSSQSARGSVSGYMHSTSGCIRLTPSSPAWMMALGSAVMEQAQGHGGPAPPLPPLTPSIRADLVLGTDVVVDYRKGMLGEVRGGVRGGGEGRGGGKRG